MAARERMKAPALLASLGAALCVLWGMLLPGYILTLDLVWVPHMPVYWSATALNNGILPALLIAALTHLFSSWIIEKLVLVALFMLLFWLPYRTMPISTSAGRAFAAAVFALNPFVYARFLAGQWLLLFGYALIPLVFASLMRFTHEPSNKNVLWFCSALVGESLFSTHFTYLLLIASAGWLLVCLWQRRASRRALVQGFALAVCGLLLLSSYWLLPALLRTAPAEARFSANDFETYAAAQNFGIPAELNVLALGGYWGEATAWGLYFHWPQQEKIFWLAAACIGLLIVGGAAVLMRDKNTRPLGIFLLMLAILAYITALGAADTPARAFNMLLYAHMPLWSGLRDSQKIAAFLAYAYAFFAGVGVQWLLRHMPTLRVFAPAPLLLLPAVFGLYVWGGFHGQLRPAWYPASWYQAKARIDALLPRQYVLALPWHGYYSLGFDRQIVVANPASAFFGDRVIAGKSVEAGTIHDEETDPHYRALDLLLGTASEPSPHELASALLHEHVSYVLVIKNAKALQTSFWSDQIGTSTTQDKKILSAEVLIDTSDIELLQLNDSS